MTGQSKIKFKKIIILSLMAVFVGVLIYSGTKLFQYEMSRRENEVIQEIVEESIVINDKNETLAEKYQVDFEKLKKQNSDVMAYLKVNGTKIDYVVVRGSDNSFYLKHNLNRNWSELGWVFVDYRNSLDGNDKNIVIYGHDLTDGTMLGSLKETLTREWQDNKANRDIIFVTERETAIYEVFSTYEISPESYYISTDFGSDEEYANFLNVLYYRSNYDYGVLVDEDDTILTLSTCADNGAKRIVLHAKKQEVAISY